MPNWCSSCITFYSKEQMQLQKMLNDFFEIYREKPTVDNSFGYGWMGNYANRYLKAVGGSENVDCRGLVCGISDTLSKKDEFYYFKIETQTAWSPKIAIWREIIKDNYSSVSIAYCAEECGNEVYNIWDELGIFYDFKYAISSSHGGEYFDRPDVASKEELIQELKEIYSISFDETLSVDDIVMLINQQTNACDDDEEYLYVNTYREVNPSDYQLLV